MRGRASILIVGPACLAALVGLAALSAACGAPTTPFVPTVAASAVPSQVPSSAAPVPIATPTMTVLEWMQPYTLDGLRAHDFGTQALSSRVESVSTDVFLRYRITYRSDGLLISGTLQVPAMGEPPFPVIVMNHGFFNREEYQSGDGTDRAAEYLNRHGYLTLSSDYRSWGRSQSGTSLYYSGLVTDVVNLMGAAAAIPEADVDRMGVWGHSMGGGVTMKVLTLDTPARAAVLYSPVSADDVDILERWGLGCIGDVMAGEHQLGCNSSDVIPLDLPPELIKAYYRSSMDAEVLQKTSPIYNLQRISVPIQINFGTEDGKTLGGTPPEWSRKLYAALRAEEKPVELFSYEGESHSFVGDNWIAFMERSAHFFDKYVKDIGP